MKKKKLLGFFSLAHEKKKKKKNFPQIFDSTLGNRKDEIPTKSAQFKKE